MGRPRLYRSAAEKQRAYRRRRKGQPVIFRSTWEEWETPPELFAALDAEFRFDTDVAALPHNAKCPHYYSPGQDGLRQPWRGTCWLNPPYGKALQQWVSKAYRSACIFGATVVCLLPARTDTAWWHDYVLPYAVEIRYLRGRVQFGGASNSAPFPSVIVVFAPARVTTTGEPTEHAESSPLATLTTSNLLSASAAAEKILAFPHVEETLDSMPHCISC